MIGFRFQRGGSVVLLLLALAIMLGVAARIYALGARPFWLDEAYSNWAVSLSWRDLWTITPRYESHPPFYYSLLKAWRGAIGDGVVALRALSVIASLGAIALTMAVSERVARTTGAGRAQILLSILIAGGLIALSPLAIDLSRQARPYGLHMLAVIMTFFAVLHLARTPDRAWRWWLLYLVGLELTLWLHSLGMLFAFCLASALLLGLAMGGGLRRALPILFAIHVVALLAYLPCLAMIADYARNWSSATWLEFRWIEVPGIVARVYSAPSLFGLGVACAATVSAFAVVWRQQNGRTIALMLGLVAFGPFFLSVFLSVAVAPVLLARTLSPSIPLFAALIGIGMASLVGSMLGRTLLIALFLPLIWANGLTAVSDRGEDWSKVIEWIDARRQPGDAIWVYPNEVALPLRYAYRDLAREPTIREVPAPFPALGVSGNHPSGTLAVVTWGAPALASFAARHHGAVPGRIWLVTRMPGLYDPQDDMGTALAALRPKKEAAYFDRVRVEVFDAPSAIAPPQQPEP